MEQDDWDFSFPAGSNVAKRRNSIHEDDLYPENKRIRTAVLMQPSHQPRTISPSWARRSDGTQGDDLRPTETPKLEVVDNGYLSEAEGSRNSSRSNPTERSTCFGVVVVSAISSFTDSRGSRATPVSIQRSGDVLKLKTLESGKYAGLISNPALSRLLDEVNVKLIATLAEPLPLPNGTRGKKEKISRPQERSVRIVVYGSKTDRFIVGSMLSDTALYLQQPSAAECERDAEYFNPHYLVRPGSQMPKLDTLSISSDRRNETPAENLDEVNKNRFMQIFDIADGMDICSQIRPSGRLSSTLKDHQLTALAMMVERECGIVDDPMFPSIWERKPNSEAPHRYRHRVTGLSENFPAPVHGGVLADDMGLGKTLSLLALICSSLDVLENHDSSSHEAASRTTLVVAPKSTIPGWQHQITKHIKPGQMRVAVYHGSARRRKSSMFSSNNIVLTTYETLRSDWIKNGPLYSENWDRLVLDEAHHIRNRSSKIFKAACAVVCRYRWCLTGTPIHNSLDDYGALLSFIGVSPFTEKALFDYWISSPIKNGKVESFKRLQNLVTATCLRRTKRTAGLSLALPQRIEQVEDIRLHLTDRDLYDFFKAKTAKIAAGAAPDSEGPHGLDHIKENKILVLINFLRLICNHGTQLLPESALQAWKAQDGTSVDWQLMQNFGKKCDLCEGDVEEPELASSPGSSICSMHTICENCASESTQNATDDERACPKCASVTEQGMQTSTQSPIATAPPSAKIEALLRNLKSERAPGGQSIPKGHVKSVIFSFWTRMLDLIEHAIKSSGYKFQRIDGSTSLEGRRKALTKFNEDPKCTIMLASIGSAGEGVDLTVANHVHLIEPHWNPMAEAQAVDRVHRIGQIRDVVITRYIVHNSIETVRLDASAAIERRYDNRIQYVQWVQQHKMKLISRSLDYENVSQSDLDEERWKSLRLHLED